jgi:hypothetical protein
MTVEARAQKAQKVARISAVLLVVVFTAVAFTLHGKTESGRSEFHFEDQVAMVLLGLLGAAGILMFTRPRIVADRDGVRVRNLLAWKYFPWEMIAAVRFDRGSPWVALDLHDDDVISVMAVQAADKEYAVDTVRTLRRLLAESQQRRDEPGADEPGTNRRDVNERRSDEHGADGPRPATADRRPGGEHRPGGSAVIGHVSAAHDRASGDDAAV